MHQQPSVIQDEGRLYMHVQSFFNQSEVCAFLQKVSSCALPHAENVTSPWAFSLNV